MGAGVHTLDLRKGYASPPPLAAADFAATRCVIASRSIPGVVAAASENYVDLQDFHISDPSLHHTGRSLQQ